MPRSIYKTVIIATLLFSLFQQAVSGQLEDGFVAYKQGDIELAQKEWLALAIKGDVRAQFFLSVYFDKHSSSPKDIDNAKRWLTASANNGFVPAQFNMGNNFHRGKYGNINNKMAEYWWNQAAMQGFPEAQYQLATLYYRGEKGVERNQKEASYWFQQAVKSGHKGAVDAALLIRAGEVLPLEDAPLNIAYDDPRIVSKLSLSPEQMTTLTQDKKQISTVSPKPKIEMPESDIASKQMESDKALATDENGTGDIAPKIKPSSSKGQKSDWASRQPSTNYTIQLLASTISQECRNYRNRLSASYQLKTHMQPFTKKGKRYCAVIYGSYTSYSKAKSTLKRLPRKIRETKPWIRKLAR